MEKEQIREIVIAHARDVIEGFENAEDVDTSRPVTEYGAESLDVLEIVGSSAREVGVKVTREDLNGLRSIDDLVELYYRLQHA